MIGSDARSILQQICTQDIDLLSKDRQFQLEEDIVVEEATSSEL